MITCETALRAAPQASQQSGHASVNKGVTSAVTGKLKEKQPMKKSVLMLMIAGLFTATPVLAADALHSGDCIQHCAQQSESITKKIERLQGEIKKGTNTYSLEELRKLEEKLAEANYMLDSITRP